MSAQGFVVASPGRQVRPAEVLGELTDLEVKHAPKQLFIEGDASLLGRGPKVSIVGSRAASDEGLRRARQLARAVVERGGIVVSGLALGIDAAAHRGAIDAGGRTIAVIGTPLDKAYPRENAELQALIAREHLLVSQFPVGTKTTRASFPIRNQTMVLLTDATVIVEAGDSSGTLHQGWEAIRLGRPLFIMESVANDMKLAWPREMLEYGAQILSRENLDLVLDNLPSFAGADAAPL